MSNIALLVIDVQQGLQDGEPYFGGRRNNPGIAENIPALLSMFRTAHKPIFHVKHNSVNLDSPIHLSKPGNAIFPWAAPIDGEPLYSKNVSSAFIGTPLEQTLKEQGITRLVVCGLTTDCCVNTSVRMAENLGFEVFLVGDACAVFDRVGPDGIKRLAEDIHMYSLTSLHGEFCQVVDTKDVSSRSLVRGPVGQPVSKGWHNIRCQHLLITGLDIVGCEYRLTDVYRIYANGPWTATETNINAFVVFLLRPFSNRPLLRRTKSPSTFLD